MWIETFCADTERNAVLFFAKINVQSAYKMTLDNSAGVYQVSYHTNDL